MAKKAETSFNSSDKVSEKYNPEKNDKYYKKFDFFYRRTAFRTMTEYYKGLFKPHLDHWRDIEKRIPVEKSSDKNAYECLIQ